MTIGLRVNRQPKGEVDFKAGSVLYGRVYLSVSKQPQPAHSVVLKLIGTEDVVIHYTTQEERHSDHDRNGGTVHRSTVTHDHFSHSTNEIFKMEYALHSFAGGMIPVGQYEFPFALHLPHTLPSSMVCRAGQSHCEVQFELVAEVYQQPQQGPSNSFFNSTSKKVHACEPIRIVSTTPLTNQDDTSLRLPMEMIPITQYCCFRRGVMALETHFHSTTVGVNDRINVQIRCQNRSTVPIHTIHVHLHQIIQWTSEGRKKKVQTTLQERTLDASEYPELERLHHVPHRRDDYDIVESVLDQQPWHHVGSLLVPQKSHDTYYGRTIQVHHTLTVQLVTNGCCSSNPDSSTSIELYRQLSCASDGNESHHNHHPHPQHHPISYSTNHQGGKVRTGDTPVGGHTSNNNNNYLNDPLLAAAAAAGAISTSSFSSATAPSDIYDGDEYAYAHSAPPPPPPAASAPYNYYDDEKNYHRHHHRRPMEDDNHTTPTSTTSTTTAATIITMADAQVLPPDWNAQKAEIVNIPMAEATVVGIDDGSTTVATTAVGSSVRPYRGGH
jgi:hypothetical protein